MAGEPDLVEIRVNPPDLFQRFEKYPKELEREIDETMQKALLHIQGSVPPYPRQKPNARYRRTGTLGRSLGVNMGGGMAGNPEIKEVKKLGGGKYEGRFGTRLYYAPKVIGAETQQKRFKALGWWTMRDVKNKAEPGIQRLFEAMTKRLISFLGG